MKNKKWVSKPLFGREGLGAAGTTTAALAFGGSPVRTNTELWNGTNWSNENSLTTGRERFASAGISTSAIAAGGQTPSATTATEEWVGDGTLSENID